MLASPRLESVLVNCLPPVFCTLVLLPSEPCHLRMRQRTTHHRPHPKTQGSCLLFLMKDTNESVSFVGEFCRNVSVSKIVLTHTLAWKPCGV